MSKILSSVFLLCCILVPSLAVADQQTAIDEWTAADEVHAYAVASDAQVTVLLAQVQALRIQVVAAINNVADIDLRNQLAQQMLQLQPGGTFLVVSNLQGIAAQSVWEGDQLYFDGVIDYMAESYASSASNFEEARWLYIAANDANCGNLYTLEILLTSLSAILSQATGI